MLVLGNFDNKKCGIEAVTAISISLSCSPNFWSRSNYFATPNTRLHNSDLNTEISVIGPREVFSLLPEKNINFIPSKVFQWK